LCKQTAQFLQREWAHRWNDFQERLAYGTVPQLPLVEEQKKADSDVVPVSSNMVRAGKMRLLQEMKDLDNDLSTGELVRSVLNIAWEYLTLVDEKKTFALPVSFLFAAL